MFLSINFKISDLIEITFKIPLTLRKIQYETEHCQLVINLKVADI